jgi:hypothetical protein
MSGALAVATLWMARILSSSILMLGTEVRDGTKFDRHA